MESDGDVKKNKLEMFFFPYILGGHLLPMIDVARFFASHPDVHVTIITTPKNAQLFQNAIDSDGEVGHHIDFHTMPLPTSEVDLPEGVENLINSNTMDRATKLFMAVMKLRDPLLDLLRTRQPDCLVSDSFHPWTVEVAAEVGIPRLEFHVHGLFSLCAEDSVRRFKPHEKVGSDTEPFVLTGLHDKVETTRLQIPYWYREQTPFGQFLEAVQQAEEKSYGVIINGFYDLDSKYVDYFKNVMGRRVWLVGPVQQYSIQINNNNNKSNNGNKEGEDADQENNMKIIRWLDTKQRMSVLYVSFGSQGHMCKEQYHEIAHGLEASGHPFIWVARTNVYDEGEDGWFPEGFEERLMESNQGLLIKGWAPQTLILGHQNVGAFMSQCGWNSVVEGMSNRLPFITWPLMSEQFFNESFLVDVLKIAIRVGNEENVSQYAEPKVRVTRDKVEAAVRRMMGGGEEVVEMKERVKEYGDKCVRAVQQGGSSYQDVYALVEELKALRRGDK